MKYKGYEIRHCKSCGEYHVDSCGMSLIGGDCKTVEEAKKFIDKLSEEEYEAELLRVDNGNQGG